MNLQISGLIFDINHNNRAETKDRLRFSLKNFCEVLAEQKLTFRLILLLVLILDTTNRQI